MKHKILTVFSSVLLLSIITSCVWGPTIRGDGNVKNQQREAGSFDKIRVTRGMNVYLSQGDAEKIIVEADENLLDYIETDVSNNTLNITTSANIRSSKSKKVFVTVTDLSNVHTTAGSNLFSEGEISCNNLDISSSAGSNIKLKIKAEDIKVAASAGSNITLEGKANDAEIKASAGSNIKAEDLEINDCDARTSSGANIWIKVNNGFNGKASSGGNLFYYGNPQKTNIEKSSGGNIIRR